MCTVHRIQVYYVHFKQDTGILCALYTGYRYTMYTVNKIQVYYVHCKQDLGILCTVYTVNKIQVYTMYTWNEKQVYCVHFKQDTSVYYEHLKQYTGKLCYCKQDTGILCTL